MQRAGSIDFLLFWVYFVKSVDIVVISSKSIKNYGGVQLVKVHNWSNGAEKIFILGSVKASEVVIKCDGTAV